MQSNQYFYKDISDKIWSANHSVSRKPHGFLQNYWNQLGHILDNKELE